MKNFKWLPFALFFLLVDWWGAGLAIISGFALTFGIYEGVAGGSWLVSGLAGAGIGIGVVLVLWVLIALYMSYRDRNKNWRMM